jgi:hypothetical protein
VAAEARHSYAHLSAASNGRYVAPGWTVDDGAATRDEPLLFVERHVLLQPRCTLMHEDLSVVHDSHLERPE